MTKHSQCYHYCWELEYALNNLFGQGKKWDHMAGSFQDVHVVRRALRDAIGKIRKRIDDILTVDDRLRLTTSLDLDALEREVKDLAPGSNNELDIIAHLLSLVVYLLGYDWWTGAPHRHVIYYQTAEQQAVDDWKRHPDDYCSSTEFERRLEIVTGLHDQGLRPAQIGKIMRLSVPMVKNLLVRGERVERKDILTG